MIDRSRHSSRAGFTLVEVLAAFAITALVIVSMGTLTNHVAFSFDRGIHRVTEAERLAVALDRLARDFAAARFVPLRDEAAPRNGRETRQNRPVAFAGQANRVVFVSAARDGKGSEVVMLTAEALDGGISELVRRRGRWPGPALGSLEASTGDPVILLKGRHHISFSFYGADDGPLDDWTGRAALPRRIRLNVRDAAGTILIPGAEFVVRADAPAACVNGQADCLPSAGSSDSPSRERAAL